MGLSLPVPILLIPSSSTPSVCLFRFNPIVTRNEVQLIKPLTIIAISGLLTWARVLRLHGMHGGAIK